MRLKRLLRFRLATLMLLTTAVSALLAWYVLARQRFHDEENAITAIARLASPDKLRSVGLDLLSQQSHDYQQFVRVSPFLTLPAGRQYYVLSDRYKVVVSYEWHGPKWSRRLMYMWDAAYLQYAVGFALRSWRIDDRAVPHLCSLKSLKHLDLRGSAVSPEGIERLKKALPGTNIREPDDIDREIAALKSEVWRDLDRTQGPDA